MLEEESGELLFCCYYGSEEAAAPSTMGTLSPAEKIARVAGQHEELQPHLVGPDASGWQESLIQFRAYFPALIHCSAVPRTL